MFKQTLKIMVSLLSILALLLLGSSGVAIPNSNVLDDKLSLTSGVALAAPLSDDLSHRYIIFLDGIRSFSPGIDESGNPKPLSSDFSKIEDELLNIGISKDHFVYFSYRAAYHYSVGELYCLGWGTLNGCSGSDLASLSLTPVYDVSHTKNFSLDIHADALDWLLGQVIQHDPSAQIDLVGFSLGGIVASHWASQIDGTSKIKEYIHSIVLIESPVGGIPMGERIDDNCFLVPDKGPCFFTKTQLKDKFGEIVLKELQLPPDAPDSIIDTLPQAAQNFPNKLTIIQSETDYLVNNKLIPIKVCFPEWLCWDVLAPVGRGAQYWVPPPATIHFDQELGGDGLADPNEGYLSQAEAEERISKNHSEPLRHSLTVQWVSEAINKLITSPPADNPVDVYLIVDLSGSYADDLPNFKAAAPGIISTLKASNPDIRFGLGKFEDYPISPFGSMAAGDKAYHRLVDLTFDTNVVLNAISGLFTRNGGDLPESQLAALFQAATGAGQDLSSVGFPGASIPAGWQANFRSEANKIFLLWTDAPFHQPKDPGTIPYPGPSFDETLNAINSLSGLKVVGIYSSSSTALSTTQGDLTQSSVSEAELSEAAVSDLEQIVAATGAFAPTGGVDCNSDGSIDIPAGKPLVCNISSTGEGIGEAVIAVVGAATGLYQIHLPIILSSGGVEEPPVNNPPHTPANLSPVHNTINIATTTNLTWSGGDPDPGDSVTYDIYLEANDSNPATLACNNIAITTCNPPGSLLYNTDYYWKVVATDKHGVSSSSGIKHFKTDDIPNYAPYIPNNPTPVDGSTDQSVNVVLGWSGGDLNPSDTVTYDVYLEANNPNPTTLICDNISTTTCDPPGNLLDNVDYYWKVTATDNQGISSTNVVWYFRTSNGSCSIPATPSLVLPGNGEGIAYNTPTFEWGAVSNSDDYQLQVDNNSNFTSPEIDITTTGTEYTPTSGLSDGTYYWQVRGHNISDGCDVYGSWSSIWSITIGNPPVAPSNLQAAPLDSSRIQLNWNDNSTNEAGFSIWDGSIFVSNVEANTTSYTVSGLGINSYHCYHIYAFNDYGVSSWTDWACATTVGLPLSGTITDNGVLVAGVQVLLQFYDGSTWSTYATTTTNSSGNYQFSFPPPLGGDQSYYVRWDNTAGNPNRLWGWTCQIILPSTVDPNAYQCDFDLDNIDLLLPNHGTTIALPYTFTWNRRTLATDNYELNLADMSNFNPWWWTSPALGYADRYTMSDLPSGFVAGQPYGWWMWVYGPNGYGISYYYHSVTFSNTGTTLAIETVPMSVQASKENIEMIAPLQSP